MELGLSFGTEYEDDGKFTDPALKGQKKSKEVSKKFERRKVFGCS